MSGDRKRHHSSAEKRNEAHDGHKHSHRSHRKGKRHASMSSVSKRVYWKVLTFYFLWAVLGLIICLIYEDRPTLSDITFTKLDFLQILIISIFKYFLNFPLGIANWFTNQYIFTTYLLMVPNSMLCSWVLLKMTKHHNKLDKILNYILIGQVFIFIAYSVFSLISSVHLPVNAE